MLLVGLDPGWHGNSQLHFPGNMSEVAPLLKAQASVHVATGLFRVFLLLCDLASWFQASLYMVHATGPCLTL